MEKEKTKAISNEELIAAMLSSGTIREAAELIGLSERTIYDRMKEDEFRALYKSAKADLLRAAVAEINDHIADAIRTIAEIMNDKEINPAVRLQAAQTLLNSATKFTQRLSEAEKATELQIENNKVTERLNRFNKAMKD